MRHRILFGGPMAAYGVDECLKLLELSGGENLKAFPKGAAGKLVDYFAGAASDMVKNATRGSLRNVFRDAMHRATQHTRVPSVLAARCVPFALIESAAGRGIIHTGWLLQRQHCTLPWRRAESRNSAAATSSADSRFLDRY